MRTWDVVTRLFHETGARTYLELLTPSTSPEHPAQVAGLEFDRAEFLSYRTPAYEQLGPRLELPTVDRIDLLLPDERFDIVFVDPWHTMEHSRHVLRWGLQRVARGGWLAVHDCWPDTAELLGEYRGNDALWCGDTWRAFQELARSQANPWCIIDDDYGIGVIGPIDTPGVRSVIVNTMSDPSAQWQWISDHRDAPWLVSADEWCPSSGHNPVSLVQSGGRAGGRALALLPAPR